MKNKLLHKSLILSALLLILCGCTHDVNTPSEPMDTVVQTEAETAAVADPTESTAPLQTDAPTEPEPAFPAGTSFDTYTDPATEDYLEYYLHIPENAQLNMPLIVFLHGDTEVCRYDLLENFGVIAEAKEIYGEAFPFIGVTPCTRFKSWVDFSIPETLKGMIDHLTDTYSINPDQIIITGHSRGAAGVWNMISLYGDFFSAAVPVSCSTTEWLNYENCAKVPVLAYIGTIGEVECGYIPKMEYICKKIVEAGGEAELILLIDKSHRLTSSAAYTQETFEWMLAQKRSQ